MLGSRISKVENPVTVPLKHILDKAEQMKRLDKRYRYAVEQLTLQSLMRIGNSVPESLSNLLMCLEKSILLVK